MRIAIVSDTFYPQVNGVARTLQRMQEYMDKEEIEYKFFIPRLSESDSFSDSVLSLESFRLLIYPECRVALPLEYFNFKKEMDSFQNRISFI